MARPTLPFVFSLVLLVAVLATALSPAASAAGSVGLAAGDVTLLPGCKGTIAECLAGEEFDLSSEVSRRILASSSEVAYSALRADSTPCSHRGQSYYNCRGGKVNPYTRSCSQIAHCRS